MLVSATIDNGIAAQPVKKPQVSVLAAPAFSIQLRQSQLILDGNTSSTAHEKALAGLVAQSFAAADTALHFTPLLVPPASWTQTTLRVLSAIAAMESASATVTERLIEIRGVTSDLALWDAKLNNLRTALPQNASVSVDVIAIPPTPPQAVLCRRAFSVAASDNIEFTQSSAEVRTSSYATLDSIIDVAYDCGDMAIAITGHSDVSGNEFYNQNLSLARAQAVADYLIRGGLTRKRMVVTGAGSLLPVADNTNAFGRGMNRRIEIELVPATLATL